MERISDLLMEKLNTAAVLQWEPPFGISFIFDVMLSFTAVTQRQAEHRVQATAAIVLGSSRMTAAETPAVVPFALNCKSDLIEGQFAQLILMIRPHPHHGDRRTGGLVIGTSAERGTEASDGKGEQRA